LYNSSRAVDGNRRIHSGSQTILQPKPFWWIDLKRPRSIECIKLYENVYLSTDFNQRPLEIYTSNNNKDWKQVASFSDKKQGRPINIIFKKPVNARFVGIRASGKCFLQLDEVEIYAPD